MSAKILGFSLELLMPIQICFLQICNSWISFGDRNLPKFHRPSEFTLSFVMIVLSLRSLIFDRARTEHQSLLRWRTANWLQIPCTKAMDVDDKKSTNQSCSKLSSKRKLDSETNGSKILRSEGFSWWTSLLLGLEPSNSRTVIKRGCFNQNIIHKAKE